MKKEKNKPIFTEIMSTLLGGIFFAVPYLVLDKSILLSLVIGFIAFCAGNVLFFYKSFEKTTVVKSKNNSLYGAINKAKNENAEIYSMINKIEDKDLQKNIRELHETASKIIDTISKNPEKMSKVSNFFEYYLPVTLKILVRYDEIENQELDNEEALKFMKKTEDMISKIEKSFKVQLSNLYEADIIDTDAEMKVFEQMLRADGFNDMDDFNIK